MDFAGIRIGHATHAEYHTGCTVFLCPEGTVGSVEVRGPAPGSREAALLAPDKPNRPVNGVVLSGGSAFGLATADGVVRYLAERGIGYATPIRPIPIVPAAIVYDLFLSKGEGLPGAEMGYMACVDAERGAATAPLQGNVGAGAGVTVGKWAGFPYMMKGGFGLSQVEVEGTIVAAAAVVNAVGDVVGADGQVLAGARDENGSWMVANDQYRRYPESAPPALGTNTTLVVAATTASLTRIGCHRLAQRAHDGLAMAIQPAHTTHDGDTVFVLATGQETGRLGESTGSAARHFDLLGNVLVYMVAEAIRNAVRHAPTAAGIPGLADQITSSQ